MNIKDAEDMFWEINFFKIPDNELENETIICYYRNPKNCSGYKFINFYKDGTIELTNISKANVFKAIQKQIEELGW